MSQPSHVATTSGSQPSHVATTSGVRGAYEKGLRRVVPVHVDRKQEKGKVKNIPRRLSLERRDFDQDPDHERIPLSPLDVPPVGCVELVNTTVDQTFVIRPEPVTTSTTETDSSPTLDALRKGLAAYKRTDRKYDGRAQDVLYSYCCKFPKKRTYSFYKKIKVIDGDGNSATKGEEEGATDEENTKLLTEYGNFSMIKRYLDCFATLAEFDYEFNWAAPWTSNGGLGNTLVVDKVWRFDQDKRLFIPSYDLVKEDRFTDFVVSALKRLYSAESIVFVSTPHTTLFTNDHVLWNGDVGKAPTVPVTTRSTSPRSETGADQTTDRRKPLKKRTLPHDQETASPSKKKKAKTVTFADDVRRQETAAFRPTPHPSNPTLVVFKHDCAKGRAVVCSISIEMHLSNKINYSY